MPYSYRSSVGAMVIWRVNAASQTLCRESAPEACERLGGRGLLAQILVNEIDATCDRLSRPTM
jgi:hypothetical protein